MNKIWIGYFVDQLTVLLTVFIALRTFQTIGLGVFSDASFLLLCPILFFTSIEAPIICEAKHLHFRTGLKLDFWSQFIASVLLGLFISGSVVLLAKLLHRPHPFALFCTHPMGKTGLQSLEEGWLLIKLQFGFCGVANAIFHGAIACLRQHESTTESVV